MQQMEQRIEDELKTFIESELLENAPVRVDEQLIATGRLDSLGLIQLLGHVQERWRVDLLALAGPEDFVSVAALAGAIRRHRGAV